MHDFEVLKLIVETVAKAAKLKSSKPLYDMGRHPALSKLRDTTLFLVRAKTKLSYAEIGRAFRRDHATILCAVRREEQRLTRGLPPRPDGRTLQQWHAFLSQQIDAAIAAATISNPLPN
jgi:hypothetical protein